MDADLYTSTKFVLESVGHMLTKGTIILFDEWFYNHSSYYDDHEARAFLEFADQYNVEFEEVATDLGVKDAAGDIEQKLIRIL
jgi:hypothetical protein